MASYDVACAALAGAANVTDDSSFSSNLNDSSFVNKNRLDCNPNDVDVPPITDADIW